MSEKLIREFLDELSQRAESRYQGRLHQAFVDWYVEAEFGQNADWKFTDDHSDGGIDAIVWRRDEKPGVIIVQSKFKKHVGRAGVPAADISSFHKMIDAFYYRDERFEDLLSRVRDDLRRLYRMAYNDLKEVNNWLVEKKAFRFITTARRPPFRSERLPATAYQFSSDLLELYRDYRKAATPKARPLQLRMAEKITCNGRQGGTRAYLFNAHVSDFQRYLNQNDVARLVARNIRNNLGGRIGRDIRLTYEKAPVDFWYLHNGLTIICDSMAYRRGIATLVNPSVVNGAQTLYALSSSKLRKSSAIITTRVIVRNTRAAGALEDDSWIQSVIRGVNTQNRVKAFDFRSNEPEQIELQHHFRDLKVYYERKRGEWRDVRNEPRFRGFARLSIARLANILTIAADESGSGVLTVKRGTEKVFDPKNYDRIFPAKNNVRRRFAKIYLAYRVYRLLEKYGYQDARTQRRQRHAFWNSCWLLHRAISNVERLHSRTDINRLRERFDEFEGTGVRGRSARKRVRFLTKQVWAAWRHARKRDIEKWTANNFFKSSYGNRKVLQLAWPRVRTELRLLGRYLVSA